LILAKGFWDINFTAFSNVEDKHLSNELNPHQRRSEIHKTTYSL
jgi:hypothetical protein